MPRLVTVMPSWAPESWVDRVFMPFNTPWERRSPVLAAASTSFRLTVMRENSAATKAPHAATSTSPTMMETTSTSSTTPGYNSENRVFYRGRR